MVSVAALAEFFHVLFGVMWVGASIYIELVLVGPLRKAKNAGEFKVFQGVFAKTGPFQIISGVLVVVTGLVYMVLTYGTDLGLIWASPSGKLILIALALVAYAIVAGVAVITPRAIRLTKMKMPEEFGAPIPAEVDAPLRTVLAFGAVNTIVIVVVLFLMVVAAHGGF